MDVTSQSLYIKTLIAVFLLMVDCIVGVAVETCSKIDSCSCSYSNGTKVDLSKISKSDDAFFKDIDGPSGSDSYSFNPCQPFTEQDCANVTVCNIHQNIPTPEYFVIGTDDTADFSVNDKGQLQITYKYVGTGSAERDSFIALICDKSQEGSMKPLGENPVGSAKYYFEVSTKYVCNDKNPPPSAPPSGNGNGISIGTILCIALLVLAFVYIAAGITFNIFVRKNSGTDVIPNKKLWAAAPGLVKDGFVFVIRRGKTPQYSKI